MKTYKPTIIEDVLPDASGAYQIGSSETPFASGNFTNINCNTIVASSIYGDGSHITGLQTSSMSGYLTFDEYLMYELTGILKDEVDSDEETI